MDNKKLAKELLTLASAIMAEKEATAARKSQDATDDAAAPAEEEAEDPKFTEKVQSLRPAVLKKLNKLRKRKVKQLSDKLSLTMTVEGLIDVLNDLVAKV